MDAMDHAAATNPASPGAAEASRRGPDVTTYYAPPARDCEEEFCRKLRSIQSLPLLDASFNAVATMVMVLNANREIIAVNQNLLEVFRTVVSEVVRKRPGEALGCIRAAGGPNGCGTSRYCATCGAVNAILESQAQDRVVARECRILVGEPPAIKALELMVTVTPFHVADDAFFVATIEDISRAKRLAVLQRTFFHDVLNTAGCLQSYAQILLDQQAADAEICREIAELANQVVSSIQSQRDLTFAESGDLPTRPAPVQTRSVLEELRLQYLKQPGAQRRLIQLAPLWDGTIVTDRLLLLRVLGNMLKNALEAGDAAGTVTMGCADRGAAVVFSVHNAEVMPEEVQLQVFQRSFSTKEPSGRGIGTYSMKLFGERYLGGTVDFRSTAAEGTTFTLTIPKRLGTGG
jgi:signal transduction histidine kinase